MSTSRCEHGNVVSDTVGDYRCFQCEPLDDTDIAERDEQIEALEARVEYLEGIVAQLAA